VTATCQNSTKKLVMLLSFLQDICLRILRKSKCSPIVRKQYGQKAIEETNE